MEEQKHAKKKTVSESLCSFALGRVLCACLVMFGLSCVLFVGVTYSWYTMQKEAADITLESANYHAEVSYEVEPHTENLAETETTKAYTKTWYTTKVTIEADGTANNGYVRIKYGGKEYDITTKRDGEAVNDQKITFSINNTHYASEFSVTGYCGISSNPVGITVLTNAAKEDLLYTPETAPAKVQEDTPSPASLLTSGSGTPDAEPANAAQTPASQAAAESGTGPDENTETQSVQETGSTQTTQTESSGEASGGQTPVAEASSP